jgi:3-hydroxyacyl-CoA dehydrogenase
MFKPFRTVAVLGAGVMGTQIAAHLANAGLTVHLLDMPAKTGKKNELVETAFKKALKQSPPIFFSEKLILRVQLGNFEDDFDRLADVDWVIEAVIEQLEVKQQLLQRLEGVIRADTIVSTNTSGLPIHDVAEGRSLSFRQRFLGTHFFNPPRYLKLLELIPTVDTDTQVLEQVRWFGQTQLGKGVVIAKDTPNFIANRIGIYVTMLGLKAWIEQGYTIEEIDALTGELIGRPKSATFRTTDLVGLDTLMYVAKHLYPAIPDDRDREIFRVPDVLYQLVIKGALGAKAGQGFYKKQNGQILSVNLTSLSYEPAQPMHLEGLEAIAKLPTLKDRLQTLYQDPGRAGAFFQQTMLALLNYSAQRIPEITHSIADLDRAMRWGFGWEQGPFELWDSLGWQTVLTDMRIAEMVIPDWIETMEQKGATRFYYNQQDWNQQHVYEPGYDYIPLDTSPDELHVATLSTNSKSVLWQNAEAALLDLGDGVALYEFRSKGNTLSQKVMEGFTAVLDRLETSDLKGLVIGNDSANFSGGANLAEIVMLGQSGNLEAIAHLITQFQQILQRIHYFPKPIVAAVQGRVLGGGCELVMACPHVVAATETYMGLVELSVGLIPGAGGLMRTVARVAERAATDAPSHIQPFLQAAFETIAMAKVSNSAYEAQALGFLPACTTIVMNSDRRLGVAKAEVLHRDRIGYTPPPVTSAIRVLGRPARAVLEHIAYIFQQGGYASEYDRYLADRLAYVLTGGDLTAPALVSEAYLLQLERDTFLPLLSQPKTQERIGHMLKTKKPLRN